MRGELDSFNVKNSIIHFYSPCENSEASAFKPYGLDPDIVRKKVTFQQEGAKNHGTQTENFMEWFEGIDSRDNSAMAVLANTERSRHEKPSLGQDSLKATKFNGAQNGRELSRSKVLATERDSDFTGNLTPHKFSVSPMQKNQQRRDQSSVSKVPSERNTDDY